MLLHLRWFIYWLRISDSISRNGVSRSFYGVSSFIAMYHISFSLYDIWGVMQILLNTFPRSKWLFPYNLQNWDSFGNYVHGVQYPIYSLSKAGVVSWLSCGRMYSRSVAKILRYFYLPGILFLWDRHSSVLHPCCRHCPGFPALYPHPI